MSTALEIPELVNNPFRYRIGKVYGEFNPQDPKSYMYVTNRTLISSHNDSTFSFDFLLFLPFLP